MTKIIDHIPNIIKIVDNIQHMTKIDKSCTGEVYMKILIKIFDNIDILYGSAIETIKFDKEQ